MRSIVRPRTKGVHGPDAAAGVRGAVRRRSSEPNGRVLAARRRLRHRAQKARAPVPLHQPPRRRVRAQQPPARPHHPGAARTGRCHQEPERRVRRGAERPRLPRLEPLGTTSRARVRHRPRVLLGLRWTASDPRLHRGPTDHRRDPDPSRPGRRSRAARSTSASPAGTCSAAHDPGASVPLSSHRPLSWRIRRPNPAPGSVVSASFATGPQCPWLGRPSVRCATESGSSEPRRLLPTAATNGSDDSPALTRLGC